MASNVEKPGLCTGACCKAWDTQRALGASDGVAPTAATCSAAVRAGGAWQQQLELVEEMRCERCVREVKKRRV